jgi:hypothetical protein
MQGAVIVCAARRPLPFGMGSKRRSSVRAPNRIVTPCGDWLLLLQNCRASQLPPLQVPLRVPVGEGSPRQRAQAVHCHGTLARTPSAG